LIDHATTNKKVKFEVGKKVFLPNFIEMKEVKIQNCRNTPCDLHSTSRSWFLFPRFGIENLAKLLEKPKKAKFQLKNIFFPQKNPFFLSKQATQTLGKM